MHAKFPMIATWDDHEVVDNYAGNAPGGGLDAVQGLLDQAQERRLQGVLRGDAVLPVAAAAASTADCASARRRHGHARPAPIPRRSAVRRRRRRPVRGLRRPARVPRPGPDGLGQAAPCDLPGRVEDRRQRDDDDERRAAAAARTTASTPGRATATSAKSCWSTSAPARSRTSSSSPATSTRSSPETCARSATAASRSRSSSSAARSPRSRSARLNLPVGGGQVLLKATTRTRTRPQAIIDTLRGLNPWVDQADFDHHGYGLVEAEHRQARRQLQAPADDQAALTRDVAEPLATRTPWPAGRSRSRASTDRRHESAHRLPKRPRP